MRGAEAVSARFSALRVVLGNPGQYDRIAVGKLGDKREVAAHCLYIFSQRRYQKVAALFELGDAFLANVERPRNLLLRELAGMPELGKRQVATKRNQ
jgi:hypothetical protein